MPISTRRHKETTLKGDPLYIVETPNEDYAGVQYKVRFNGGLGKTTDAWKAQMFSESHGYKVRLHEDLDPWIEVSEYVKSYVNFEEGTEAVREEEDEEEVEDY